MTRRQRQRRQALIGLAVAPVLLSSRTALALDPIFTSRGKAIRGYDPVAYFTAGEPQEGLLRFTHRWKDALWYFVSAESRETFTGDPERYAPRYGGYCAWAVSQGYTATTDPEAWKIVDGKLYMNYSKSVQRRWEQDIPGNIAKADKNWPIILAEG